MANSRTKYGAPPETKDSNYPAGTKKVANFGDDELNIVALPDGTLEVKNLKERSSDGLSYHLNNKTDKVYYARDLDSNTEVQYIPQNVDKVYNTKVSLKEEINYMERLWCYIFTENRDGSRWNQIFIDTTNFGPYNYDVKLEVTKDIDFINDLIVVRSGDFSQKYDRGSKKYANTANRWGVAWVSPHNVVTHQGNGVYTLTGTTDVQTDITMTGAAAGYLSGVVTLDKNYHVSNAGQCYSLSSRHIQIPKGQNLHSGLNYYDVSRTSNIRQLQDTNPLSQRFYYTYTEYTGNMNTEGWDGTIPSGVPFSIESWSTNPKYIGFDGEITIKPVSTSAPTCTYSADITGTASDLDYQQSVRKAVKEAKKRFHKALNKILVSKGIKNKSSRQKRYETLLERVAQNAFDGLSLVRNEQIAKVQGLESNPLSAPVYYDGTIKEYGGTKSTALYNTEETWRERNTPNKTTGGTGSSSSSSSSSSGGGGGSTY